MGDELVKFLASSIGEVRELVIENNAEIRELRGEFRTFKENVQERFKRDEEAAGQNKRNSFSVISIFISLAALAVSVIVNFFKEAK